MQTAEAAPGLPPSKPGKEQQVESKGPLDVGSGVRHTWV